MKIEKFKLRVIKVRDVLNRKRIQDSTEHVLQLGEETVDDKLARLCNVCTKNEKPNNWADFNNWNQWANR